MNDDVVANLKEFVAKLPKYSSHYGKEKNATQNPTLAPGLTKSFLYEKFSSETGHIVSKSWFYQYWVQNIPVTLY